MTNDLICLLQNRLLTTDELYRHAVESFDTEVIDIVKFHSELSRISAIAKFCNVHDSGITSAFTDKTFELIADYRSRQSSSFSLSSLIEKEFDEIQMQTPGFITVFDRLRETAKSDVETVSSVAVQKNNFGDVMSSVSNDSFKLSRKDSTTSFSSESVEVKDSTTRSDGESDLIFDTVNSLSVAPNESRTASLVEIFSEHVDNLSDITDDYAYVNVAKGVARITSDCANTMSLHVAKHNVISHNPLYGSFDFQDMCKKPKLIDETIYDVENPDRYSDDLDEFKCNNMHIDEANLIDVVAKFNIKDKQAEPPDKSKCNKIDNMTKTQSSSSDDYYYVKQLPAPSNNRMLHVEYNESKL